jgi:hypothetical protein
VLYATRLPEGNEAFIAKSIIASHPNPLAEDPKPFTQSKGWFCKMYDSGQHKWGAIREPHQIPSSFRRLEVGTDLYITGYREDDWEMQIRHSVLRNFFAAIHHHLLEVNFLVNGSLIRKITSANLEDELNHAADEARKTAGTKKEYLETIGSTVYYLKALRNPFNGAPFTRDIEHLGNLKLYVYRDVKDAEVPERWACMRRPMMVVEEHGSSLLSRFAAVIICDSEQGNHFLAQMEDPRHSRWNEDEARAASPSEKKKYKSALHALKKFVQETLKQIQGSNMPPKQDIPLLGRYLPADGDGNEENYAVSGTEPTGKETGIETGHRATAQATSLVSGQAKKVTRSSLQKKLRATLHGGEDQGETPHTEAQGIEGVDPDDTSDEKDRDGSQPGGPGSNGESRSGGTDRSNQGDTHSGTRKSHAEDRGTTNSDLVLTSELVRFRSFVLGTCYVVVLESRRNLEGDVILRAVGEDSSYALEISSARLQETNTKLAIDGPRIKGLSLAANKPLRIELEIVTTLPLCLGMGK